MLKIYFGTIYKHELFESMFFFLLPCFKNNCFDERLTLFNISCGIFLQTAILVLPTLLYTDVFTDVHGSITFMIYVLFEELFTIFCLLFFMIWQILYHCEMPDAYVNSLGF